MKSKIITNVVEVVVVAVVVATAAINEALPRVAAASAARVVSMHLRDTANSFVLDSPRISCVIES